RTGLSQRTIRYYGEVELVTPSSRTEGGFRLYTDRDVARLELIKTMKPMGYTLDEMRDVLDVIAHLEDAPPAGRAQVTQELAAIREVAATRRAELASKLAAAESFLRQLDEHAGGGSR
ncbi:MAG TPA: MerR family transcriptional regulator, partial [Actinomycetaceae bacterium]|nr:MerR family transcriptional regulator [Actinomycetaceae bacterium]